MWKPGCAGGKVDRTHVSGLCAPWGCTSVSSTEVGTGREVSGLPEDGLLCEQCRCWGSVLRKNSKQAASSRSRLFMTGLWWAS